MLCRGFGSIPGLHPLIADAVNTSPSQLSLAACPVITWGAKVSPLRLAAQEEAGSPFTSLWMWTPQDLCLQGWVLNRSSSQSMGKKSHFLAS